MNTAHAIKKMVGVAVLLALSIILSLLSNIIRIGSIEINLSLIPIAIGAMLYDPLYGLFLGLANGGLVLLAPGTSIFLSINPVLTVFLCLLKTGIAGLLSGLFFRLLKKKNFILAIVISSLTVPVFNTGIFLIGCLIGFYELFGEIVSILLVINFVIEIAINIVLAPTIIFLIRKFFDDHQEYVH